MTDPRDDAIASMRAARAAPGEVGAVPVAAATVVLIRPGPDGPEILLTRRPSTMAFAANVHVFPGGRVDPSDTDPANPLARGLSAGAAADRLAGMLEPAAALAHHVAAVRETLEETGIRIDIGDLVPMTRWVTPEFMPRRFDVRFFAAIVPAGTEIVTASPEVAASRWITADQALREVALGTLAMLLPTIATFEQLRGRADRAAIEAAFEPGTDLGPPMIGAEEDGLAAVEQRWAGGIVGRSEPAWLVGRNEVVLVDASDPTGETMAAIDAALAERGARVVGVALTGIAPERAAGVRAVCRGARITGRRRCRRLDAVSAVRASGGGCRAVRGCVAGRRRTRWAVKLVPSPIACPMAGVCRRVWLVWVRSGARPEPEPGARTQPQRPIAPAGHFGEPGPDPNEQDRRYAVRHAEGQRDGFAKRGDVHDREHDREIDGREPRPSGPNRNPERDRGGIQDRGHAEDRALRRELPGDHEVAERQLGQPEQATEHEQRSHDIDRGGPDRPLVQALRVIRSPVGRAGSLRRRIRRVVLVLAHRLDLGPHVLDSTTEQTPDRREVLRTSPEQDDHENDDQDHERIGHVVMVPDGPRPAR